MQTIKPIADRVNVPFELIKAYAGESYNATTREIAILSVEDGRGTHTHDSSCNNGVEARGGHLTDCTRHLDDSDWIVTVEYPCRWDFHSDCQVGKHQAIYGVLDGIYSLWID